MPVKKDTKKTKKTEESETLPVVEPKIEETKAESPPAPAPVEEVKKEEEKDVKNKEPSKEKSAKDVVDEAKATKSGEEEAKDMSDAEQVVVFTLVDEEYAVPILDVQEIIPSGDITPFPNVADYIEGIINVRGTVATIINLAKRFKLTRDENKVNDNYVVLTNISDALFGMMVDEVTEVTKIAQSDIKPANSMVDSKIHSDYISGVAVVGQRVILILDFSKILNEQEVEALAANAS